MSFFKPQSRSSGMWDITFDGFNSLQSELTRFETRATHAGSMLEKSFEKYGKHIGDVFDNEGAVSSTRWAHLSDWRMEEREQMSPILNYLGGLRKTATEFRSSSTSERRSQLNAGKHTDDKSGFITIKGAKVYLNEPWINNLTGNRVPGREFWPFGSDEMDILIEPFNEWVDGWVQGRP